ncbi:MAG: hypothetical protein ACLTDR_02490 [Adlercreutzia equolifaciens]
MHLGYNCPSSPRHLLALRRESCSTTPTTPMPPCGTSRSTRPAPATPRPPAASSVKHTTEDVGGRYGPAAPTGVSGFVAKDFVE